MICKSSGQLFKANQWVRNKEVLKVDSKTPLVGVAYTWQTKFSNSSPPNYIVSELYAIWDFYHSADNLIRFLLLSTGG